MSSSDGSCQKLRNYVYICLGYAEKTLAAFFPDTLYTRL